MAKKVEKKSVKKKLSPTSMSATKEPKKPKAPQITEAMFEAWFFGLQPKIFTRMQKEWNEKNLKIDLTPQKDYDGYLNYFKTLPPNTIRLLAITGLDSLSTEAYAALSRWHDIISNPHRIDKIHQSGLTNSLKSKEKGIVQMAFENDRLGVLRATRDQLAQKIAKGASARDTATLAREITDVMSQIASYEKRMAPGKKTKLGMLLEDMPTPGKRAKKKGVRNTSFKSRVTIDDLEAANE